MTQRERQILQLIEADPMISQQARLTEMVEETFEGSMPAFIAAFSRGKRLSREEVDQLRALIDSYEEN